MNEKDLGGLLSARERLMLHELRETGLRRIRLGGGRMVLKWDDGAADTDLKRGGFLAGCPDGDYSVDALLEAAEPDD